MFPRNGKENPKTSVHFSQEDEVAINQTSHFHLFLTETRRKCNHSKAEVTRTTIRDNQVCTEIKRAKTTAKRLKMSIR